VTASVLLLCLSVAAFAPVPTASAQPKPPFALPATFIGYGPCGDCGGLITVTLTLQANNLFVERDVYRRGGSSKLSGFWHYNYSSDTLKLSGRAVTYFRVLSPRTIEPLDSHGDPISGGCLFRLRMSGPGRPCADAP
jgi:hypothetical protein